MLERTQVSSAKTGKQLLLKYDQFGLSVSTLTSQYTICAITPIMVRNGVMFVTYVFRTSSKFELTIYAQKQRSCRRRPRKEQLRSVGCS